MITSTITSQESAHIWLCDGVGDVYVSRNFQVYKDSFKIPVMLMTEKQLVTAPSPSWEKVDCKFNAVVGGYSGLVCGVQEQNLCIRLGVTQNNPSGDSWGKVHCEAAEVAVGAFFIIRRTSGDQFFFTDMKNFDPNEQKSVLVPKWNRIPPCPASLWKDGDISRPLVMSLDERDTFFLIDHMGNVCVYSMLGTADATWCKVCNTPAARSNWLNWLTFWRTNEEQKCMLSSASEGQRSIWCLDLKPGVIWQLVLSYVSSSTGKTTLKTSWVKFNLPTDDELVCFCADKCAVGGLLCAAKRKANSEVFLLYCSLNMSIDAGNTPVGIPGPLGWSSSCKSLSICRTVYSIPSNEPGPSRPTAQTRTSFRRKVRMPYSALSREGTDQGVCCENGDCFYCKNVASRPSLLEVMEDVPHLQRKRGRAESAAEPDEEGVTPKRARSRSYTHHTLDGVEMAISLKYSILEQRLQQIPTPSQLSLPLTVEQLESKYHYDVELEREVIAGTFNYFMQH